jgi:formiminotetrahydrofolate cyclodeaminase
MSYKITLDTYLNKLAARSPVPGGGSSAALVGAIAMSLLSMITRYTLLKVCGSTSYTKLSEILDFTECSRRQLRAIMNKDEQAYLRLSRGIKRRYAKDITNLYEKAAEVPMEICRILKDGIKKCEELSLLCRGPLVSDLAEATLLLEAGFLSAKFNVEINLPGIRDSRYTKKVRLYLSRHKIRVARTKERILRKILNIKPKR